jgi:2-amino-4-hydroxy-6-hydroxymethyldihydropteridine diphosphokinase
LNNAVLSLGSNLGDRLDYLTRAIKSIEKLPRTKIKAVSKVYETSPVGFADQDDFLNLNIEIETFLSPQTILGACLGIESCLGRDRVLKDGPRTIDIDLLLYENVRVESYELILPHPRMMERSFVLKPLLDIYPNGQAPGIFFAPKLSELGFEGVKVYSEEISY